MMIEEQERWRNKRGGGTREAKDEKGRGPKNGVARKAGYQER